MANRLYAKGAEKILSGAINFPADTIKISLVINSYVENLDTDEFYTSISANVIGANVTLAGKTVTGGKFDANDPLWAAVAAGSVIECFVVWKDTGVAATSPLIARIDAASGLPFATNGGDIAPVIDAVNGLFKLVP